MKYLIINTHTNKLHKWNLNSILREINRDRTDSWVPYNKSDWKEGLETLTEYKFLKVIR